MVDAPTIGARLRGGASRLCVLRGRERGPAGADRPALQGASNSSSLAEDTSANQFQSPCAGYSAGPIHFQRSRSAASGALLEGRCGEPALAATHVGTGAPTHRPALSSRRQWRRPMSYHLIPADTNTQLDVFGDQGAQPLVAHIWRKEKNGFYVDPQWCSERLYEDEPFVGSQWDPFCGIGRCSDAARRCGYKTYATDIVDRGYQTLRPHLEFPAVRTRARQQHRH